MQFKRASFLTKLVVMIMLIAASVTLLRLQGQITAAQAELSELRVQYVRKVQKIADLRDAVEHSEDPDRMIDVARSELRLVTPDEKIIIFTD